MEGAAGQAAEDAGHDRATAAAAAAVADPNIISGDVAGRRQQQRAAAAGAFAHGRAQRPHLRHGHPGQRGKEVALFLSLNKKRKEKERKEEGEDDEIYYKTYR